MPKIGYNIKEHEETRRVGTNPTLQSVYTKKGENLANIEEKVENLLKKKSKKMDMTYMMWNMQKKEKTFFYESL